MGEDVLDLEIIQNGGMDFIFGVHLGPFDGLCNGLGLLWLVEWENEFTHGCNL